MARSAPAHDAVEAAVGGTQVPGLRRELGELGMLREVSVSRKGVVEVGVAIPSRAWPGNVIGAMIAASAKAIDGVGEVAVDVAFMTETEASSLGEQLKASRPGRVGGVGSRTRIITVASGKGGVGKSSVTANTAVALAASGQDVAVIDADVWGYSIPKMLGVDYAPLAAGGLIIPPEAHGVRAISMDFFVAPDQAVVWRGPMLHKALEQFLDDVWWDEPDFLLVDMPPGTGDVAISLSQFLPRSQALIVTTPQITAQRVAKRAAKMAEQVNQEVVGVVENMSWFTGDDGKRYEIFGNGGGEALAVELAVPLFGRVPLLPELREGADRGEPVILAAPGSEAAVAFEAVAEKLVQARPRVRTHPELVIN